MRVEFEVSQDDFVYSAQLAVRIRDAKSKHRRFVKPVCGFLLFAAWVGNIDYFPKDLLTWTFPFIVVGSVLFIQAMIPVRLRRQYREEPYLRQRRTLETDDTGLRLSYAHWDTHAKWASFGSFLEDAKLFILFDERDEVVPLVPKRVLSLSQIEELRFLLRTNLGPNRSDVTLPQG